MASLQLTLLGGFAAQVPPERPIKVASRKNQALLAFLSLNPGRRQTRERLVDLLWGEGDNEHGRNSLRQALTALRRDLAEIEPAPVTVEGEVLSVPANAVEVDALTFEQLAGSDRHADLQQAVDLYRGDLLDGLALAESGFDEWLSLERSRIREIAIDVYTRLIPDLTGPQAIQAAERLVALDPLREASQGLLISLLADQGQSEIAVRQYRRYSEALERELGLQPSPDIQSLHREIAGGRYRKAAPKNPIATAPRRSGKNRVAVLPFENRSPDPAQQSFCDALSDDIADAVSRISNFLAISRASTAAYSGQTVDVRRIGAELEATHILQGGVLRFGDRLRISARLCDAVSGHHMWADQYDCTADAALDAQDAIVRAIAAATETHVMLTNRDRLPATASDNLSSDELIDRGLSLLYGEQPETLAEALSLGERAVTLAPKDPRAHELLGYAFVLQLANRFVAYSSAAISKGMELARTALATAPENEWSHLLMARIRIESGDLESAIADSGRALEINPSAVFAHARLAECYALQGRSEDALTACRTAFSLDPRGPESYMQHFTMGLAHFTSGNDAESCNEAGRATRWRSGFTRADLLLAAAATALGRKAEAEAALARCLARYPDLRAGQVMPRVMPPFARAGDRARLEALLRDAGLPDEAA